MCLAVAVATQAAVRSDAQKPFTLVVDPGHGGKDYGCVGRKTNEKTIVLDVARRLGDIIKKEHPEIKQVYTRDTDRYLTLQQRADVANGASGDLFVSIHVNSVDRRSRNRTSVRGASVYTLGLHKSDNNLNVAMRENAVMELEQDYSAKYQGFDPNSSESYIMFELNQNSHVANSLELASGMQAELISTAGRADKNVRQAGLVRPYWFLGVVGCGYAIGACGAGFHMQSIDGGFSAFGKRTGKVCQSVGKCDIILLSASSPGSLRTIPSGQRSDKRSRC